MTAVGDGFDNAVVRVLLYEGVEVVGRGGFSLSQPCASDSVLNFLKFDPGNL